MKSKLTKLILSAAMLVTAVLPGLTTIEASTKAATVQSEYEIYPLPHNVEYQSNDYMVTKNVNVVYDEKIDQVTKDRLNEVLSSKNKEVTTSLEKKSGMTNILVGVYNSGSYVDTYVQENYTIDTSIYTKDGAHFLASNNNEIVVLGKDTDAAFYGITTLKHVFNQMPGSTIRNFTIHDYADVAIRGFIEGYYGIPWSNEDRMSLMEFGGEFKMTSYIFAPKDDPYHKDKWREDYPAAELEKIKEMVAVGNASKCRFVWTAHPFMGGFDPNQVDSEIAALLHKFDQLYEAGVRQFGVLGDDVGGLPREIVIQMMNAVSEWAKAKGDVYDTVFCPGGYNHAWQGDYSELNQYDAGFPKDVQIFWTGEAVCQPIEQKTLEHFRRHRKTGEADRRSPLFWLNWPVNDINMSRLMMGKGSLLHTDINVEDLAGAVTNPMQDAEASKVAIFAVADYAWNVKNFNDDKSWKDSFKYIDEDASEELAILAKHMSDPAPNGHGLVLAESEDLKPLLDSFLAKLSTDTLTDEDYNKLIREFEIIEAACTDFHKKSKNEKLKEELLPFTNSLTDLSQAAVAFIKTKRAIAAGNAFDVWSYYSQASSNFALSKDHQRITLGGTKAALPGAKRIIPFVNELNKQLSPIVNAMLDDSKLSVNVITNRNDMPEDALALLTDNDEATEVVLKSPSSTKAGDYVGLSFSKPVTMNDVTFKMGQSGNIHDTFNKAKLQYSVDGKEWIDLEGTAYTDGRAVVSKEGLDLKVKGVRIISTEDKGNMWLGIRDIIVNKDSYEKPDESTVKLLGTPIYNTANMTIKAGSLSQLTDGNKTAFAAFAKGPYEDPNRDTTLVGAWVGLEFAQPTKLNRFVVAQGSNDAKNDTIKQAKVEYTEDGQTWHEIKSYTNLGMNFDVTFPEITAKQIRFVNTHAEPVWWRVREVEAYHGKEAITLQPTMSVSPNMNHIYSGSFDDVLDGNDSTFVWLEGDGRGNTKVGDYALFDLGKAVYLNEIHFAQAPDGGDYWKKYDVEVSLDGTKFTTIGTYTDRVFNIDVTDQNVFAKYVRFKNVNTNDCWIKLAEFSVTASNTAYRSLEKLYTNLDVDSMPSVSVVEKVDKTSIKNAGEITLQPNDYLGVKLSRIKDLTNVDVTTAEGLSVETSLNGKVWTSVSSKLEDARYVRVINKSSAPVTFTLDTFVVESYEVEAIHVEATNFGDKASHLKAFDKDRASEAVLQGSQVKGNYITYDLGQIIDLDSLKIVLHDSTTDFPRHAKISVSTDNKTWEEVMLIGEQDKENPGEADDADNINEVFPLHEISYNAKLADNINKQARFIKFEITRNKAGADKWVRIREIELNGGNLFLPEENNPTVIGNTPEVKDSENNYLSSLVDGNVSTTYQPLTDKAGSYTYRLSENTSFSKLTILQSPSVVSNAVVSAEVISNARGTVQTVTLGTLSSSLNEFNVSSFADVLSVTIAWDTNKAPLIHEIITSKAELAVVNKDALRTAIEAANTVDKDVLTPSSRKAIEDAIVLGNEILANEYATQTMVDSVAAQINEAIKNKVEKPNMTAFDEAIAAATANVLAKENYLANTYKAYEKAMAKVAAAKANENVSQKELDAIVAEVEASVAGLVYEVNSIEELKTLYASASAIKQGSYTEESFAALQTALASAKEVIDADAATRQNPETVKAATVAIHQAIEGLKSAKIEMAATSVSLEGNIAINFFLRVPTYALNDQDAYVEFAREDGSKEIVMMDDIKANAVDFKGETLYRATIKMVARQMTDTVTPTYYVTNPETNEYDVTTGDAYRVVDYAQYVLTHTSEFKPEAINVVKAMLNYGSEAQTHFNYKKDTLANASLSAEDKTYDDVTADTLASYAPKMEGSLTGLTYHGSSVLLKSETTISHYFTLAEGANIQDYTFTLKGKEDKVLTPKEVSGKYVVDLENIFAKNLGKDYVLEVTVKGSQETFSASCSVLSYARAVMNDEKQPEELKTVVKALYKYNQAAIAYANAK